MHFNFVDVDNNHPLISSIWQMSISTKITPYSTPLLSTGETFIVYSFTDTANEFIKNETAFKIKGIMISGQIYGAIQANYKYPTYNLGIIFKPTAFYKLFGIDMSTLTNRILPLENFDPNFCEKLKTVFIDHQSNTSKFKSSILNFFEEKTLIKDKKVLLIDEIINLIIEKEGLITVNEIVEKTEINQKTLESHFKKIIGLTPGKYIRQFRFISLIKKYQNKDIDIKDLAKEFKFHDTSHFNRDFKFFLGETPLKFFKKDYLLLEMFLKE